MAGPRDGTLAPPSASTPLSRRRLLARLGSLGLVGLAATACGPVQLPSPAGLERQVLGQAQRATGAAPPPNQLQWVTPIPPPADVLATPGPPSPARDQAKGWAQMLDPWQASHPSITLVQQVVPPDQLTQQQLAIAHSSSPADVAYTDWGRTLGEASVLDPLDVSLFARKIVPAAFASQTAGVQIYALPVFLSCLGLYVGHARFQAADLSPTAPLRDWSSFETAMLKLTDRPQQRFGLDVFGSGSPLSGQMRYGPFIWTAGGDFFDDAGTTATWDQTPGLDALVFLARLAQNYASPGAVTAADALLVQHWLTGQTATILAGPELTAQADQQGLAYSIQSVPAYIQGQSSSLAMSAGAMGIFSTSNHKDWALDFVHYLAGKDAQIAGLTYLRLLPANTDAGDDAPVFQQNSTLATFLRILREDDIHPFPLAASRNAEVQKIFQAYYGVALQGLATPEAAWNKSAAAATALLHTPVATPTAAG
jgi:multiple sugar transport system substrate-binding protein